MSAFFHTLLVCLSIILAYVWLQTPALNPYSLQAFAVTIIAYLVIKRLKNTKLWHVSPAVMSTEMPLVTFAFLLVIGYTGNTQSVWFPLSYVHLFFLVFSSRIRTAIAATLLIVLFHYSLVSDFSLQDFSLLATLPLMTFFFIFAKDQYYQSQEERTLLEQDEAELSAVHANQSGLTAFLTTFLQPKLKQMTKLLEFPQQNQHLLTSQITLIQVEIEKIVARIASAETPSSDNTGVITESETQIIVDKPASSPPVAQNNEPNPTPS